MRRTSHSHSIHSECHWLLHLHRPYRLRSRPSRHCHSCNIRDERPKRTKRKRQRRLPVATNILVDKCNQADTKDAKRVGRPAVDKQGAGIQEVGIREVGIREVGIRVLLEGLWLVVGCQVLLEGLWLAVGRLSQVSWLAW